MDIVRPEVKRKKRIRRIIYVSGGLLLAVLVTVALSRLKPAAPTVVPTIAWAKLGALAEGARLASQKLWGRPA